LAILMLLQISQIIQPLRLRKIVLIAVSVFVFSGNFWIYPEKIAQGWDSTMGHIPYFELREDALKYIQQENIDSRTIGGGFTLHGNTKYIDLKDRNLVLGNKNDGLEKYEYILYTNATNDYTDEEINTLYEKWTIEKSFCKRSLCLKLFRRRSLL